MPLEASQSCFMIPFSCIHCYLKAAMWAQAPQTHLLHSLSREACGQSCLWVDLPKQNMGKSTHQDRLSPHSRLLKSLMTLSHLCHLYLSEIRGLLLPGMFSLQQMLWSWANTALSHLCTPTYQTIVLELTELTLFSKQAESSLWIKQSLDTNTAHV